MNPYTQAAILSVSTLRMLPHIVLYLLHKKEIDADLEKYSSDGRGVRAFIKVATRQRVFRNLFYYRLGEYTSVFIQWMLPPERTLHIWCPEIGEGAISSITTPRISMPSVSAVTSTASSWSRSVMMPRDGVRSSVMTSAYILVPRCLEASVWAIMW